jgi:hypothetical protein
MSAEVLTLIIENNNLRKIFNAMIIFSITLVVLVLFGNKIVKEA